MQHCAKGDPIPIWEMAKFDAVQNQNPNGNDLQQNVTTLRSAYGMSRPSVVCRLSVCNELVTPQAEANFSAIFLHRLIALFQGIVQVKYNGGMKNQPFFDQYLALLSRRSRQQERLSASVLYICLFVCQSVCLSVCLSPKGKKKLFSQKLSDLELWSLDDLQEVVHGLFEEPIIGPLKSKMAEIRHLET